jgi:hypothetical protein
MLKNFNIVGIYISLMIVPAVLAIRVGENEGRQALYILPKTITGSFGK